MDRFHITDATARRERILAWEKSQDPPFGIWAPNKRAIEVFCAVQTQWIYAGMSGVRVGISYPALESAINMMGLESEQTELFEDVQCIEAGALTVIAQKAQETAQR